jgi:hypothetical protein
MPHRRHLVLEGELDSLLRLVLALNSRDVLRRNLLDRALTSQIAGIRTSAGFRLFLGTIM